MTDRVSRRASDPQGLVELYSDEVWRFTSSQIARREDAEDVVMDVYSAALASFDKIVQADDQRLWMFAIARRKIADFYRRKYRRDERPLEEIAHVGSVEPALLDQDVRFAMGSLSRYQAEVLVLKYVNGLSTEEVSQVIRKSLPATNSLLQRAREAFREALGPAFLEPARRLS